MIRFFNELIENLPEWGPQMLAAAGQTLSVSVDLDGVTMSIPGGDLETVDRTRGFTAKIPKKGDYTFELENGNDKAREITVTVKIQ